MIIDDALSVPGAPCSANVRCSDIGAEQGAGPIEGEIDDAVIPAVPQGTSPGSDILVERCDILDGCPAVVDQCMKIVGDNLTKAGE